MKEILKALKEMFEIKENTPSFIVSGFAGCAVSAILIVIRMIWFYFFS